MRGPPEGAESTLECHDASGRARVGTLYRVREDAAGSVTSVLQALASNFPGRENTQHRTLG